MRRLSTLVSLHAIEITRDSKTPRAVSPDFLAALTANESGGDPHAKRFEPAVYRHLKDLAEGRTAAFGSISKSLLGREITASESRPRTAPAPKQTAPAGVAAGGEAPGATSVPAKSAEYHAAHLTPALASTHAAALAALRDEALRDLASSWGLTQIMGYHMLGRPEPIEKLCEPAFHYARAAELISEFAARFHLDPQRDFEALFRCWNTGRPDGNTFDPGYVENGLRRAGLARRLRETAAAAAGEDHSSAAPEVRA